MADRTPTEREPRTEAGREFLRRLIQRTGVAPYVGGRFLDADAILDIESEAAGAATETGGLDVQRLAKAFDLAGCVDPECIAAEYDRLSVHPDREDAPE